MNGGSIHAKQHLPVLDGIRAVAVLIVICFHFWQGFSGGSRSPIGRVAVWGQTGVDLFFVLSGFLITGILLESRGSAHFLRNFYARRILRIFPLYYATLLVVYLVSPLLHMSGWIPLKRSIWYLVYLQNIPGTFAPSIASGPGHFWSLAVEEHYYLFWPFLVMLLTRDKLLKATGVAVAVSILTRIVLMRYGVFYFTLARLDGLGIGSAVAILARTLPEGLAVLIPWAKRVLYTLLPVMIITQLLVSGTGATVIQILKSTLIAIVYACVMILAVENSLGRRLQALLSGRVLGSVGRYSYGMYVLHPFILSGLHRARLPYGFRGLLAGILLTYVAAWVSWTVFEKRFLRLRRYFEYDSSPLPPSVPVPSLASARQ